MKKSRRLIFALLYSVSGFAGETASRQAVQQAKALMAQGQREAAIAKLEQAITLTKNRKEQQQVAERRLLFAQQFLTSESFQKFQEAKALAEVKRWDECIRELSGLATGDQSNLLILRLKARCYASQAQFDAALNAHNAITKMIPSDREAFFGRVELALEMKNFDDALRLLDKLEVKDLRDVEQYAILRAKTLERLKRPLESVEILRRDQEANLDHIKVLYELGMLYRRIGGNDWPARKMLSLFITRCKRFKDSELKDLGLDELLPTAQTALSEIDRKLGV